VVEVDVWQQDLQVSLEDGYSEQDEGLHIQHVSQILEMRG